MSSEPVTTATGATTSPLHLTAPGVTYSRIAGVPGRYFRCEPYRATLSVSSCAERWRRAQNSTANYWEDRFGNCRACPIGAAHNGLAPVHRSPIFGMPICPRSRVWTNRMIRNRVSVSQYNRELEFVRQRNGKGTPPEFRFDPRRLAVVVDGQQRIELRDDLTGDTVEIAVQVLRTVVGRVVFTRPRVDAPAISTIELADRFKPKSEPAKLSSERQRERALYATASKRARMAVTRRAEVASLSSAE